LGQCRAGCSFSFDCTNSQCVKAAAGTTGKYPNKTACDVECRAPPGPTPIPPCDATNYREFWCTTANDTESFHSLATKLHVNPHKLGDYNFLYDYGKGVKPADSLRVPFDQCTPKVGAWNCYTVKAGDTLQSVAPYSPSLIQGTGAADKLKSYNLDILYSDDTLYPGQQLRLPIHICFEDEKSDCHIVKAKETLESIAKIYNTTCHDLYYYANNADILNSPPEYGNTPIVVGWARCHMSDRAPVGVGMELSVPTLRPAQPSPCTEIPGYWSCYTVKANDTIWASDIDPVGIPMRVGVSRDELIEVNFGKQPSRCCGAGENLCPSSPYIVGGCSNTTQCSPSKGPYPDCLQIGQVLTVPVAPACVPRPGVWDCKTSFDVLKEHGNIFMSWDFFCKANRRVFWVPWWRVSRNKVYER
jgi:hypothetical protein